MTAVMHELTVFIVLDITRKLEPDLVQRRGLFP